MTKEKLIALFYRNHQEMLHFISSLSNEKLVYSHLGKWTPGQQLNHIFLCLAPISQVLSSKEFIARKFGNIDRPAWDYDQVIENYKTALGNGGKAPESFVPQEFDLNTKDKASNDLAELLGTIQQQLDSYTEEDLNSLVLPHPLLGKLTIREMFYLMTYHATHHLKQTERNLETFDKMDLAS